MKVYIEHQNEWYAVDSSSNLKTLQQLADEVLKRSTNENNLEENLEYQLVASPGGFAYKLTDRIQDVLENMQFLKLETVQSHSSFKSHIPKHAESQNLPKSGLGTKGKKTIILNGEDLTTQILWRLSTGSFNIQISPQARSRIEHSRDILDDIVDENRVVYGVTTGFGKFARVVVPPAALHQLQINLITSHCAGVGDPLSVERTRMLLALRINILCKGYSGISPANIDKLVQAFNASCLPWIPEKGTVGASGDLAPLSHLAYGLMGKGLMWSPKSGWADASFVLEAHGISPIDLGPKEGLAMINGTQFIGALGSEALERAHIVAMQADVVAALSTEVLLGTARAFDAAIHEARPHPGQLAVAKRLRTLLQYGGEKSQITNKHHNCNRVQDAYAIRCCPQVHGIAHDTIGFVRNVLNVELNSATDNPMVLRDREETISGGNFHGEYPAKVLDYLAIGVHEIGSMSERRIERLVNPAYSDLPAFLVKDGGLNNGYMIPHCTAAALVSENKCLCHPASVDSLSTSAGQEDHVSMGGWSARKAIKVIEHVENIVAIELLCACQAMEFHRPLRSTDALEAVYATVRKVVSAYEKDRAHHTDIEAAANLLRENKIWNAVSKYLDKQVIDGGDA